MKRTIALGSQYSSAIGIAIDTMAAIDFTRNKGVELVGSVIVSKDGFATYYPPRQSKYKLVFRGLNPVYDDIGDSENWLQKIDYVVPPAPIMSDVNPVVHVRKDIQFNYVTVTWHQNNRSAYYHNVVAVVNDEEIIVAENVATNSVTFPVDFSGEVLFFVYSITRAGVVGIKSNKVSVTLPPVSRKMFIVGDGVEASFELEHNLDTYITNLRAFYAATEEEITSGFTSSKIDKNTTKIDFDFIPDEDSIKIIIDVVASSGNMSTYVYDTNGSGVVDTSEHSYVADSLDEDYVLDGGEW